MSSVNDASNFLQTSSAPSAAPSEPSVAGAACPRCTKPMDPATATFDDDGSLVCVLCANAGEIDRAEQRAAMAILGPAIGGTLTALVSFLINPFWIVSVLAIASSIGALLTLLRHPEYKERMGWRVPATWFFACLGVVLALIPRLLLVAGVVTALD